MASHPPGQCCTIGVKHEGTAQGSIRKLGDYDCYISHPSSPSSTAILILPDVIGHEFINAQLIADQFAANGYLAVMPDLFRGDPVPLNRPEGFDVMKWKENHGTEKIDPVVISTVKAMKSQFNVTRIGAVGYCFGAKYVVRFLGSVGDSAGTPVQAGYVAHPSFVDAEELQAIAGPLSIAAAETDNIFTVEKRHESEEILKKLSLGNQKLPYQINLYSGVEHGFAVRADLSDKRRKYAKEQAFIQAVQWFDHFLKG